MIRLYFPHNETYSKEVYEGFGAALDAAVMSDKETHFIQNDGSEAGTLLAKWTHQTGFESFRNLMGYFGL